ARWRPPGIERHYWSLREIEQGGGEAGGKKIVKAPRPQRPGGPKLRTLAFSKKKPPPPPPPLFYFFYVNCGPHPPGGSGRVGRHARTLGGSFRSFLFGHGLGTGASCACPRRGLLAASAVIGAAGGLPGRTPGLVAHPHRRAIGHARAQKRQDWRRGD